MRVFKRKDKIENVKTPSWSEIVAQMCDSGAKNRLKYANGYSVADVVYSPDGEHRFVILKSDKNFLTFLFENLRALSEEEIRYSDGNTFAYWEPKEQGAKPVFDDMEILLRELRATAEYKAYFNK